MDLPRAELRYHGMRAVTAAIARRRYRLGAWLRPRAAPLAITALATLCMLAGLDLIAHDFRKLRAKPAPQPPVIYLMSMREPSTVIPVELAAPPTAAAPQCDRDVQCFLPPPASIFPVSVRRVHHLNCGTMRPPVPAALGQPGWRGRGEMVCHCLVIETERDGLVLVDSGFSTADVTDRRRLPAAFHRMIAPRLDVAETARAQIAALGLDPEDVRHVVLTHLDIDHAAGIADFPAATIHVHTREHRAATERATLRERERYLPVQWAHGARWQLHAERGDTWRGVPAIARLPGLDADIGMVPLHGHSRGHSGVLVRTGDRWLLHAGDAYFHPRALEPGGRAPFGLRAFEALVEVDRAARWASVDALRRLRQEPDVDLVCAHEPGELAAAQARARVAVRARTGS